MGKLSQLMETYVEDKSYEDLLSTAKECRDRLVPFFNSIDPTGGPLFILHFLCTAMAIDNQISIAEYEFFCDLFNLSMPYSDFMSMVVNCSDAESITAVNDVFDRVDDAKVRQDLINLFMCCAAIDDSISDEEEALFLVLLQ